MQSYRNGQLKVLKEERVNAKQVAYFDFSWKFCYALHTMAQDKLIRLVSVGAKGGIGKGHTYYTRKNKKTLAQTKFEFKKYNPLTRKHEIYKEKKK